MAEIWRSLWRRFRLGHRLEQRRQRDEHGRRLERTYRAAEDAHREAQIWLRSCSPAIRAAATQRLTRLNVHWQRARVSDDLERTAELSRLEVALRDSAVLMRALSRLETAAEHPRRWIQELLAAGDGVAPAPRRTRLQPRRAAQVPDLLKLARLAERLANLQHRYQALVAALPTAEHDDLIAQMVMPLERAFRQLAGEAYKLWAARFPAQANAAGEAAFKQMQELLRSGSQPTSPRPNYAPSDDDFRLINADPAPGEAEE